MKEIYGDVWRLQPKYDAVAITTNGYVKKNGEAVMGRGVALEAARKYPKFPYYLGLSLREFGNCVNIFSFDMWNGEDAYTDTLFSFPVKPVLGPNGEMGWKAKAELEIIKYSAEELMNFVEEINYTVLLPRPGCGNGGLKWEQVKEIIEPILDDRVTVVTWHPDE